MICVHEHGENATAIEIEAVTKMLSFMRPNIRHDPWKVELLSGFSRAAETAAKTGDYQLLYTKCRFFW